MKKQSLEDFSDMYTNKWSYCYNFNVTFFLFDLNKYPKILNTLTIFEFLWNLCFFTLSYFLYNNLGNNFFFTDLVDKKPDKMAKY